MTRIHPSHYTHLISNPVTHENGFSMIFTSPNHNNYNDRCYAFIIAHWSSGRTTLSAAAYYTNPIYSKALARTIL